VPPVSGGVTPVFHRYYDSADLRPAFRSGRAVRDERERLAAGLG
jgi:nitric-oxide synthase